MTRLSRYEGLIGRFSSDDYEDIDIDSFLCGEEHPYWQNSCIRVRDHVDKHEDAEGHEWTGHSD